MTTDYPTGRGHEPPAAVDARRTFLAAASVVIVVASSLVIVHIVLRIFEAGSAQPSQKLAWAEPKAAATAFPTHGHGELNELRQREQAQLSDYEWLDGDKTVARIPISRAMQLTAERRFQPIGEPEDNDATKSSTTPPAPVPSSSPATSTQP